MLGLGTIHGAYSCGTTTGGRLALAGCAADGRPEVLSASLGPGTGAADAPAEVVIELRLHAVDDQQVTGVAAGLHEFPVFDDPPRQSRGRAAPPGPAAPALLPSDEPALKCGPSRPSQKLVHELIAIGVVAATCGRDAFIESIQQSGSLLVIEAVVATHLGLDRAEVHDLALSEVRGFVEHETAVVDVGLERLHHARSLPAAVAIRHQTAGSSSSSPAWDIKIREKGARPDQFGLA
jgi:hypothetical protein